VRIRWRRPLTAGCTFSIPSTTIDPATAALQRLLQLAVNVRVVTVESGRLVRWKGDVVLKRLARIDDCLDHLVRMTVGEVLVP